MTNICTTTKNKQQSFENFDLINHKKKIKNSAFSTVFMIYNSSPKKNISFNVKKFIDLQHDLSLFIK